jgi:retinol-binding protein 3
MGFSFKNGQWRAPKRGEKRMAEVNASLLRYLLCGFLLLGCNVVLGENEPPNAPVDQASSAVHLNIDAGTRTRVIRGALDKLAENYVFPDVAKAMVKDLTRRQRSGEFNSITDGQALADVLTTDLQGVSHDEHLRVIFSEAKLPSDLSMPDPEAVARQRRMRDEGNCSFSKVEVRAHNVGYLKFDAFLDPSLCGPTAISAMGFLAHANAIIFDLRENGGGDINMVSFLASYLFSAPTHLNDIWERKSGASHQIWTLPYVPGTRFDGRPVYILTSRHTFSGAEEFSYDLKALKRVTIVGETTGGGAHPIHPERIDDHFAIGIPFSRAINPITKADWEGTGVEPDVKVSAADALATAEKLAGDRLAQE